MKQHVQRWVLLTVCLGVFALFSSGYSQSVVTILPSKDNTIYESVTGALSNGAGDYFFAGSTSSSELRRALLEFDIAANVPANSIIDSVSLRLNMSRTQATSGPRTISIHAVSQEWGEGTSDAAAEEGSGAPATIGDATWLHSLFSGTFWNTPGGDFSATASASMPIDDIGVYLYKNTPQLRADVQQWYADPASNHGWLLLGDEAGISTAKRFDSKDNLLAQNPPLLTVYYNISTAIDPQPEALVSTFTLQQNYPNPFNPGTTIRFSLTKANSVKLTLLDASGKQVRELLGGALSAGEHRVELDGSGLASGVYIYRLQVGAQQASRKMFLLR